LGAELNERDILALARLVDRMDYYKLLRVDRKALATQIRPAYQQMRRRFNPDLYLNTAPELQSAVDRIARRISEAYVVLRDPARRKAYDDSLERGQVRFTHEDEKDTRTRTQTKSGVSTQGRKLYGQAIDAERRGDLKTATESMKLAIAFEPKNEFFRAKLKELSKAFKRFA
jgi:DnaJ-class molecular chaperone